MITKNLYLKIEKTKLHNKNNFKVSKNLEKNQYSFIKIFLI